MNFLQELYANPVVHSTGWTLIHACWQITLIAFLLKLVISSVEKKSANLAYSLAVVSLLSICTWSAFTFSNQYDHFDQAIKLAPLEVEHTIENQLTIVTEASQYQSQPIIDKTPPTWEDKLYQFERYLPILVFAWLIGAVLFILRFIGGWLQIRRLKTRSLSPVEPQWLNKLEQLKQKIGIQKKVGFFFSPFVKEPVTMGHFKPIILIPLGIFANLSPQMVEAILLHELAHIKRSDYLVNIIQSLLEIIFFFHPGIWWISNNIRNIREHACDDMAVQACQDPLLYAKTLTHLQSSFLSSKNILAMSSKGINGNFTTRIKRLFGYTERHQPSKKSIAFSSLIFTGLLFLAFINPFEKANNNLFPQLTTPSEAMLFVITPSTTQTELDKIVSAFEKENVSVEFTEITYTPFGLLENIRFDFSIKHEDDIKEQSGTKQQSGMLRISQLIHLTISLDWQREQALDARGQGAKQSLVLPCCGSDNGMNDVTYPYTSTFDRPSLIGGVGFKTNEKNEEVFTIDLPNNKTPLLILNNKKISKAELLQKKLSPNEIGSIHQLSEQETFNKYRVKEKDGTYEITAKLSAFNSIVWPFEKDKDGHLKTHTFNVLHKAELRRLGEAPGKMGTEGGGITVSSDNCDEENKAFHVLNGKVLEVPDGLCYPPAISALTEVDSFFILDEKLATAVYGNAEEESAYVYYYNFEGKDELLYNLAGKAGPHKLIADTIDWGSQSSKDITGVVTTTTPNNEPFKLSTNKPKMSVITNGVTHDGDRMTMYNVKFNLKSDVDATPLCFLNNKQLKRAAPGKWPKEIEASMHYDSLVLITGETAVAKYGEAGKNDVWFFYKNEQVAASFPELIKETEITKDSSILIVLNDNIILPKKGHQEPKLIEKLDPKSIKEVFVLKGEKAIEKYGDLGENGVLEIYTYEVSKEWMLEEGFKVSPNPVYDNAKIELVLLKRKRVKVVVYNQWGVEVATLASRKMKKGAHELDWKPGDIPSGVYYINVQAEGGKSYTKSVVLQKGL